MLHSSSSPSPLPPPMGHTHMGPQAPLTRLPTCPPPILDAQCAPSALLTRTLSPLPHRPRVCVACRVWGKVFERAQATKASFDAASLSNFFWAANTANVGHFQTLAELAGPAAALLPSLTPTQLSIVVEGLGRAGVSDAELFNKVADVVVAKIGSMSAPDVARVVYGFGAAGVQDAAVAKAAAKVGLGGVGLHACLRCVAYGRGVAMGNSCCMCLNWGCCCRVCVCECVCLCGTSCVALHQKRGVVMITFYFTVV